MSLLSFFPSSFIFKAWLPGDLFCVCIAVRSARDRGCAQFSQARKTSPLYGESCMWPGKSIRVQGIFKSALVFTSTGTHVFSMQVFRLCCECVRVLHISLWDVCAQPLVNPRLCGKVFKPVFAILTSGTSCLWLVSNCFLRLAEMLSLLACNRDHHLEQHCFVSSELPWQWQRSCCFSQLVVPWVKKHAAGRGRGVMGGPRQELSILRLSSPEFSLCLLFAGIFRMPKWLYLTVLTGFIVALWGDDLSTSSSCQSESVLAIVFLRFTIFIWFLPFLFLFKTGPSSLV